MDKKPGIILRYTQIQAVGVNERRIQRLKEDLGLDEEAVEVVMNLREQVRALQSRLRELESTIEMLQTGYNSRLASHQVVYQEAVWEYAQEEKG